MYELQFACMKLFSMIYLILLKCVTFNESESLKCKFKKTYIKIMKCYHTVSHAIDSKYRVCFNHCYAGRYIHKVKARMITHSN